MKNCELFCSSVVEMSKQFLQYRAVQCDIPEDDWERFIGRVSVIGDRFCLQEQGVVSGVSSRVIEELEYVFRKNGIVIPDPNKEPVDDTYVILNDNYSCLERVIDHLTEMYLSSERCIIDPINTAISYGSVLGVVLGVFKEYAKEAGVSDKISDEEWFELERLCRPRTYMFGSDLYSYRPLASYSDSVHELFLYHFNPFMAEKGHIVQADGTLKLRTAIRKRIPSLVDWKAFFKA